MVQQINLFEDTKSLDPLFVELQSIELNKEKIVKVCGQKYKITLRHLLPGKKLVFEYESECEHGLANTLEMLYRKLSCEAEQEEYEVIF